MQKLFPLKNLILSAMSAAAMLAPCQPALAKSPLHDLKVTSIEGKPVALSEYAGKVLLIVNTASGCGYTPQYKGLQELYGKYNDKGLVVLGFPSNDFGGQEPGSNQEIKKFCTTNYSVKFPLFNKAPVSGKDIQPVFAWLTNEADKNQTGAVRWNFEKFVVSRDGKLIKRFRSGVAPESPELIATLEAELNKK